VSPRAVVAARDGVVTDCRVFSVWLSLYWDDHNCCVVGLNGMTTVWQQDQYGCR